MTVASPGARAFLADFGLCRAIATGSKLTRTGVALGTPAYMSPEQARGEHGALGPPTDVWALGGVLYEALTGRPPFTGDTAAMVGELAVVARPTPVRRLRPELPAAVAAVVASTIAGPPADRYPRAADLRDDLGRMLADGRVRGAPSWRRGTRRRFGVIVAAVVLGAAVPALRPQGAAAPIAPAPGTAPDARASARARGESLAAQAAALRTLDPARAAARLQEALAADPARDDWRLEHGLLRWALGDDATAMAEWRRIGPGSALAERARTYRLLVLIFRLEPLDMAREPELMADLRAVREAGEAAPALARAAMALMVGDWGPARRWLDASDGWEAAFLRGYVEANDPAGDPAAAVRAFDAGLAAGIPFAWAYSARGLMRARLGDLRGAEADQTAALRLRPELVEALVNRAHVRGSLGNPRGALEDADAALALRPGVPEALSNRFDARLALQDFPGALADAETLIGLGSTALGYACRGSVRRAQGDRAGALADFDVVVQLAPDDLAWRADRAYLRQVTGDYLGAIADYDRVLARTPNDVDALECRGAARADSGDLEGGIADLRAAAAAEPERSWTRFRLGLALVALGDRTAAAAEFRTFLQLAPDDPRAPRVRAELARLDAAPR